MPAFTQVPPEFLEEVERAARAREAGDLAMLVEEAKGFEWEDEARRLVDRALSDLKAGAAAEFPSSQRVLLFTGHMIDAPNRATPRFPADKAGAAKVAIRAAVVGEQRGGGIAYGIAGAASGGDILFHQVCDELSIPTRIFLALPRDEYIQSSVAHAGPEWIAEFDRLCASRPVRVLSNSKELPRWLQDKPDYSIWQRSNLWMQFHALAVGGSNVSLIALWNGARGDGPGGTEDMVKKAAERGARTIVLNTQDVFAN
jgi:hypothetical protein